MNLKYYVHLESGLNVARPGTKSLRVTVPEGIVAFLNLKSGDRLEWMMDTNGKTRTVIVKKKQMK